MSWKCGVPLRFPPYASGELVLNADDLKKVDQLLFAMLYGIHEEVGLNALRFAATAANRPAAALPQVTPGSYR